MSQFPNCYSNEKWYSLFYPCVFKIFSIKIPQTIIYLKCFYLTTARSRMLTSYKKLECVWRWKNLPKNFFIRFFFLFVHEIHIFNKKKTGFRDVFISRDFVFLLEAGIFNNFSWQLWMVEMKVFFLMVWLYLPILT